MKITENPFLYHQHAKVSDSLWPKVAAVDPVQFSCFSFQLGKNSLSRSILLWADLHTLRGWRRTTAIFPKRNKKPKNHQMSVAHLSASSDSFRIQFNRNFSGSKFQTNFTRTSAKHSLVITSPYISWNGSKPQLISLDLKWLYNFHVKISLI